MWWESSVRNKPVAEHKYVRLHLDGVPGDRRQRRQVGWCLQRGDGELLVMGTEFEFRKMYKFWRWMVATVG